MLVSLMATGMSLGWHAALSPESTLLPRADVSISLAADSPPTGGERADRPQTYEPFVREAASAFRLDPALIRAVIQVESAFDPWAVSRAGAQGLMQAHAAGCRRSSAWLIPSIRDRTFLPARNT